MLQTAVLSLRVLPDDHDVDVLVASLDSRKWLAVHHVGKQVKACAVDKHETTEGGEEKQWINSHNEKTL